jgi:ADP-ribose pyrophosphatase YjhB (NUDIX family)
VVNEGAKGELVESPSEAAARELKEESGMSANFSKEDLRFSGTSTGSRQTKHTWFQDTLFHVEVQNGLEMQIENGEDETQRNIETGEIIEKGEIAEKGWQKISPEFWDTFNPSHRRMLEAGLQDLFKENKIEYVHEKEPQEDN